MQKDVVIYKQAAIETVRDVCKRNPTMAIRAMDALQKLPPAPSETYKEKLNEIASALSEKFVYMNTCLNERDIILGYLGVKRSCGTHCNTDCTNTKCESHPSFAQSEPTRILETRAIPSDDDRVSLSEMVTATYYDEEHEEWSRKNVTVRDVLDSVCDEYTVLPSAQPEQTRIFVELVVEYPDPELCTYKEYKGKPYYSIKYIENGERYVGYGTYKPEVLSQYLREYFMPSAQSEQQWIPVMERLPEEGSDILVTYVEKDEEKIVPVNYGCGIWFDCIFDRALNPVGVLAWMPPPEPFQGE